jgi:hypothetical protein
MGRGAALALGLSVAAACGSTSGPTTTPPPSPAAPAALLAEARPIGRGPRFEPPVTGPVIGPCTRQLGPRVGVHVEVFGANRVVLLPTGIGTRPPRGFSSGRIASARCFGQLVTVDPTGVVLVRPGARSTLSALFRSWGQPLSARRVASFTTTGSETVRVFVGGRRWAGSPGNVRLRRHAEIVLEVGPYVPPHSAYTFPPGM